MKEVEDFVVFFLRNGSLSSEEIISKFMRFGFSRDEAQEGIQIAQDKNLVVLESDLLYIK